MSADRQDSDTLAARTFRALDTENKGYLVKREILEMIEIEGLVNHSYLADFIKIID